MTYEVTEELPGGGFVQEEISVSFTPYDQFEILVNSNTSQIEDETNGIHIYETSPNISRRALLALRVMIDISLKETS